MSVFELQTESICHSLHIAHTYFSHNFGRHKLSVIQFQKHFHEQIHDKHPITRLIYQQSYQPKILGASDREHVMGTLVLE